MHADSLGGRPGIHQDHWRRLIMSRVSNGNLATPWRARLRLSWDEFAFVTAQRTHALNEDRIVQCLRLATDSEEHQIRAAGWDFEGTLGLAWDGRLWVVNVPMAWVDAEGCVSMQPFAPDDCLRRIDGGKLVDLGEGGA